MVDDPIIIYPKWQPQLIAALVETDPDELLERVKEAEKAISKRFEKISRSTSHAAEIEAIENAMDTLDVLNWCNGDDYTNYALRGLPPGPAPQGL